MSYGEVMNLPIRAFWLMNSNVGRLYAEKDLRAVTVQASRHGGEPMEEIRKNLIVEMGDVGKVKEGPRVIEANRDEQGCAELKALSTLM